MAEHVTPYERAMRILLANQEKSFVQRVLKPQNYPVLSQDNGGYATHKMAWTTDDNKHYVYPTVMLNDRGQLEDFGPDQGYELARRSGNYIQFDDPQEADWFARNYK